MDKKDFEFSGEEPRVYLVDDDLDDRELFAEALMEIAPNTDLILFSDGEKLLKKLNSTKHLPEIIFLDLFMPKMDGEECLTKLRADERFDDVFIIIYSTVMDLGKIEELFNDGANRYVKKPSSYQALKEALHRAIVSVRKNPIGGNAIINYSE